MASFLLFLGISFLMVGIIAWILKLKKIPPQVGMSLFIFGMAISAPFMMVEHFGAQAQFYWVVLAFSIIEFTVIYIERHVKSFHDLIHHNVQLWRLASFIIIGLGFTYTEVAYTVLSYTGGIVKLIAILPLKVSFGIFIHTVLTSMASLIHVGALFAESLLETLFRFLNYYLKIALISISHYLYNSFNDYQFSLYVLPFLALNLVFFFWIKNYLDRQKDPLPDLE